MASAAACAVEASCLFSPRNSCKCACGRSSLLPDGQWQDGYVGEFNCGPGEGAKLPSNQNLGGGSFNWRCLYGLYELLTTLSEDVWCYNGPDVTLSAK
ncbi:hypothetical protein OCS_01638 [Ophiocordyceps sinensis CO18]|nr:hypothetical protein OCS_01638 [Ophiocordyceps sinensis CO18]